MAIFHHQIKSGRKGTAREHAVYIERRGRYRTREDLVHSSYGNLPAWTAGDPLAFWHGADLYERRNGAAYREHEIALPNALTDQQLIDLAESMVRDLVGSKPYQYAIHRSEGKLGGISNPHLHLMYSDRMPDGVDRTPRQSFSRYNSNHPEKGGCRKDSGGRTHIQLREQATDMRKTVATLQNQALERCGSLARVDHRSLRDQGIHRVPERHLGPGGVRQMTQDERDAHTS